MRKVFVSQTDDIVVLSIRASKAKSIQASLSLAPHDMFDRFTFMGHNTDVNVQFSASVEGEWLTLTAKRPDGKMFGAMARVATSGGQQQARQVGTDDRPPPH